MAPALRFDAGARYGAAIVGMLFAAYLGVATDFSAIVQSEVYAGTIRNDAPIVNVVQFVLIVGFMAAAVGMLPTSPGRRVGAVTLVCVTFFLWATFGLLRGSGRLTEPAGLWDFVLHQGLVTLVAAVGGWVIARGRHPLAWIVVVVAVVPAIVASVLTDDNFTTGGYALAMEGLVIVCALAAVWAAAGIDRLLTRRPTPSPPPSPRVNPVHANPSATKD